MFLALSEKAREHADLFKRHRKEYASLRKRSLGSAAGDLSAAMEQLQTELDAVRQAGEGNERD